MLSPLRHPCSQRVEETQHLNTYHYIIWANTEERKYFTLSNRSLEYILLKFSFNAFWFNHFTVTMNPFLVHLNTLLLSFLGDAVKFPLGNSAYLFYVHQACNLSTLTPFTPGWPHWAT